MKKIITILCLFFLSKSSFEQVLLEDKTGDQIVGFKTDVKTKNLSLIKLNTGEQSLGFNYIVTTYLKDPNSFSIHEFGIKAKPTEGYAAVLSTGQFSPGINISYGYTKVNIFNSPATWGGFFLSYNRDKYLLFNSSNTFQNQVYSKNFDGFRTSLNYNRLFKSIWIFNVNVGYVKRNNFDDLNSVEIKDVNTSIDMGTMTERELSKTRKAKSGVYRIHDASPLIISLTRATATDPAGSPDINRLKLGFTGYLKNLASSGNLPLTNAGLILFLTKQDNKGIRNPILGMDIRVNDIFDNQDKNQVFFNKIEVGFTTNFSL